jgi:hypothetical protein
MFFTLKSILLATKYVNILSIMPRQSRRKEILNQTTGEYHYRLQWSNICLWCNTKFWAKYDAKTCSHSCRTLLYVERKK